MAKTRFIIRHDEVEKQLFSVEEAADLHLTVAVSSLHADLDLSSRAVKQFKTSVHNSLEADPPGRTLHTTIRYRGGQRKDYYSFFPQLLEGPCCVPIIAMACPDYSKNNHKLKIHRNDNAVRIIAFRSEMATMFCLVFVVTKNFEVNHLQGFSVNRVPFGQYDIITYTTFLSLRSHPETTVNILYDRANIDGVALNEMQKRMPVNASELEMFAQDQVKDLFRVIFERAANRAGEPAQLDDLELMSSFLFSRWPNAQVGDDFVYGLNARANNEPIFSPMFTDGVPKPPGWPY